MARNRNTCRLHCWGLAFEPRLQRWGRRQYDLSGGCARSHTGDQCASSGEIVLFAIRHCGGQRNRGRRGIEGNTPGGELLVLHV